MRVARLKMRGEGCYYHLMNRVAGTAKDRPFGEREKAKLVKLIKDLSRLYTLEVISYACLSNHVHIILFAPGQAPTTETVARRYEAFYNGKRKLHATDPLAEELAPRLHDISWFMRDLQQRFTVWFNRTRPVKRRGGLWADRFKSVILEGQTALWNAVKYIELNAVRAGMVEDPADYRYCSWGEWCGSGRHPFARYMLKHMRRSLGDRAANWTLDELQAELRGQIARTLAMDDELDGEEVQAAYEEGKTKPPLSLRADRRLRYWTDGLIIGSRDFVREVGSQIFGHERAKRKRFTKAESPEGDALYSYRKLQTDL